MIECAECGAKSSGSLGGWLKVEMDVTELGSGDKRATGEFLCPRCAEVAQLLLKQGAKDEHEGWPGNRHGNS